MAVDSSPFSTTVFSIALLVISLLVLLLLRHYIPLRSTPAYLLVPVFLAIALPASIILLVPIDLATNAVEEEDGVARGIWLPNGAMIVLPLLGDYADSGNRSPRDRMLYSIRSNVRYQLIILTCSILVLVYYIFTNGFNLTQIKGTAMALAYAWGLVLAIYLMGHGLVALPRRLLKSSSIPGNLRQLQSHAPAAYERMTDSMEELEQLESQVVQLQKRKTGTALDFRDWIQQLAETSDFPESRAASHRVPPAAATRAGEANVPNVVTERYLAELTRKLKRARHKRIRFIVEWDHLVKSALDKQAILDASGSQSLTFEFSSNAASSPLLSRFNPLTPYTRYHLHATILPYLRLAMSVLLGLASILIIWSETLQPLFPKVSLVGLSVIHHPSSTTRGKIGFAGQITAAFWLLYMCAAALTSVREVKVWGNRALVRRHTYAESATWYACTVAKLTVPLSYNFITLLPASIYHETAFFKFLGHLINSTPLFEGFSDFFPMFVLVPVIFAVFNLYGRIGRFAGFGMLEEVDDFEGNVTGFATGGWREGKALLERERLAGGAGAGLGAAASSSSTQRDGAGAAGSGGATSDTLGLQNRSTSPRLPASRAQNQRSPVSAQQPYTDSPSGPYRDSLTPTPPQSRTASSTPAPASTSSVGASSRARPSAVRNNARDGEEEEEDTNFFSDFAHRVKNTFDTVDKPDFSGINFSKPKWLDGNTGSDGEGQGPLDRLFGGKRK
ncbi:MAG: hypothetical protein M1831_000267 [Alyxoria varia]|nr:MAG: hypothetical protein M1831_000267 [Alyxoria varia]